MNHTLHLLKEHKQDVAAVAERLLEREVLVSDTVRIVRNVYG